MPDYDKLSLVAMNLEGLVDPWFVDYIEKRENLTWTNFTKLVLNQLMNAFGGSLVAQFNKLRQVNSVQNYIQEFEEMRALTRENNSALNDEYFFEEFYWGTEGRNRQISGNVEASFTSGCYTIRSSE